MIRRFAPGDTFTLGGIECRIVTGKKVPRVPGAVDLRMDIRASEWTAVPMALGFLFADFFSENEDVLYPRANGYQGGRRYLNYIEGSVHIGWEAARDHLRFQQNEKRKRDVA